MSGNSSGEDLALLQFQLQAAREELSRADQKAAILLAGVSILLPQLMSNAWEERALSPDGASAVVPASLMLASLILFGLAVFPRTKRASNPLHKLAYFSDQGASEKAKIIANFRRESTDQYYADQIWEISRIVNLKYAAIKSGIISASLGLLISWLILVSAVIRHS